MSGSEFKTEREHKTSSKYDGKSGYKTGSNEPFKKEELEISEYDINKMNVKDLQILKRTLGVKTKATKKAALKREIKKYLKDPKISKSKNVDVAVAENRDESSLITVRDKQDNKSVIISDYNATRIKELEVEQQGNIVVMTSKSQEGDKILQTVVEVVPEEPNYSQKDFQEISDNDKRGFRGRNTEKQVKAMFEEQGYEVKDVSKDRKKHFDLEVIINNKKVPVEVKEYNERIEGKEPRKGRLQFERKYVKQMEKKEGKYVIVKTDKSDNQEIDILEAKDIMKLSKGKGPVFIVSQDEISEITETETEILETETETETEMETYIQKSKVILEQSEIPNQFSYSENIIKPKKYPNFPSGSDWKDKREIHQERRDDYIKQDLPPILHPIRGKRKTGNKQPSNEIVDIKELKNVPKVDILHEKGYPELKEHKNQSLLSTGGQNLQNVYSNDLEYKGVYFQDSTHEEPINHFAIANEIWVDSDDAGHYIAYMNNLFTQKDKKGNPDPYHPNVRFKTEHGFTEPKAVNESQAIRFWVANHIDSAGYRRNLQLSKPVITQLVGKKALSYRSAKGKPVTFALSEQKLAICNAIYNPVKQIIIKTADMPTGLSFPFIAHDIMIKPDDKPILAFKRDKEQDLRKLTSDDMIRIMVDTMELEPDQAQSTLEALYQAEWINYPRSDTTKAEHEHIYLLEDIATFEGTNIEKQTLQIIKDSETAYKSGSNYKDDGEWQLINKKAVLIERKGYKLPYMKKEYPKDEFDITIQSKGMNPSDLTEFISDNEIGTPATRMTQLAELKEAGIVKKVGDVYIIDKRGLIFTATYDYYNKNSWSVINLKQQLKDEDSVQRMIDLLAWIQPLTKAEKEKAIKEIKAMSEELIEAEKDLATLEGF